MKGWLRLIHVVETSWSAEKPRGPTGLHRLPAGNLSSRRQTLLSKVSVPKNLLERQLSGDKIGATVLAVWCVPYRNGRGQRVVHRYFITFEGGNVAGLHKSALYM